MNNSELYDKILQAANAIHEANLRGGANYIIASTTVADAINNLPTKKELRKEKIKIIYDDMD